jgi:hypothetical protein
VNPKLKRFLDDTPAQVSGVIVLLVLVGLFALVTWSGLHHPRSALRFLFGACVGGTVAYRVFRTGSLRLDPQRTVTGGLAKALGAVGGVLLLVSGYFAAIVIHQKLVQ